MNKSSSRFQISPKVFVDALSFDEKISSVFPSFDTGEVFYLLSVAIETNTKFSGTFAMNVLALLNDLKDRESLHLLFSAKDLFTLLSKSDNKAISDFVHKNYLEFLSQAVLRDNLSPLQIKELLDGKNGDDVSKSILYQQYKRVDVSASSAYAPYYDFVELRKKNQEKEEQIENLHGSMKELNKNLDANLQSIKNISTDLSNARLESQSLTAHLQSLRAEKESLLKEKEGSKKEIADLAEKLSAQSRKVGEKESEVLGLISEKSKLHEKIQILEKEKDESLLQNKSLLSQHTELEKDKKEHEDKIVTLEKDISSSQQEIVDLARDKETLSIEFEAFKKEFDASSPRAEKEMREKLESLKSENKRKVQNLESHLKEVEESRAVVEKNLKDISTKLEKAEKELGDKKIEINKLHENIRQMEIDGDSPVPVDNTRILELEKELSAKKIEIDKLYKKVQRLEERGDNNFNLGVGNLSALLIVLLIFYLLILGFVTGFFEIPHFLFEIMVWLL